MFLIEPKPITPSLRHTCLVNKRFLNINKFKNLSINIKYNAGRDMYGHISTRHKGNRSKRLYKIINFNNTMYNIPGIIKSVEYDPNRSSFISLILYKNGLYLYQIATYNTKIGDTVTLTKDIRFELGSTSFLKHLPEGSLIHNLERNPGKGSVFIRSAGTHGILLSKLSNGLVTVKLPSKKILLLSQYCKATIGIVSNIYHRDVVIGKAGRNRWKGIRPNVRGVAMNPIDHPHGGGEGKKSKRKEDYNYTGNYYKGKKTSNSIFKKNIKPLNKIYL